MPREKSRDDPTLLYDIYENARRAVEYVAGKARADFEADEVLQDAVTYRVQVVGEAARFLSKAATQAIDVPWGKITRTRHRLVHDYNDVSLSILWNVATVHLPDLVDKVDAYLRAEPAPAGPPSPTPRPDLRGKFLVLDGGEGCGKSTQAARLRDDLTAAGLAVRLVRDPGTTRIGELVRAILLDPDHDEMAMRCEMLLYMAARAQMMAETIRPALGAGEVVICDRFVSSTLAYQLGGDGLTADDIRAVARVALDGRGPDLTILLDMPPEASIARVTRAKDRIEQRSPEYHQKVRENYLAQAAADPVGYRVVAADRSPDAVAADVRAAVGQ